MARLPLEGIRILDMTVVWAGTYCTMLLADLGAEVIRIESIQTLPPITRGTMAHPPKAVIEGMPAFVAAMPGRDPGERPWNRYPLFNAHARNKLSMTVDLLRPEGMEIFKRLVKISDGFIENNVTETMDKLGISYEMLQEQNREIIMLRMPAYGNSGPYKNYRSFGIHMEGVIGHTLLRGYADRDPSCNTNVYTADAAGGVQGAFAMLAALHYRNRTGKGQLIELAQAENMVPYLGQFFMDYSMNGRRNTTLGNRHSTSVQGCYRCKGEDRWVNITLATDGEWRAFCGVAGLEELAHVDRFADAEARYAHHDEIDGLIARWTADRDHYDVMEILQKAGIAAGPVLDQRDAHNDPHLQARGTFEEASQEDVGTHLYTGSPYKMSETPIKIRRGPVQLGQDNEYVYKTLLEMSDEEYVRLERDGHIGMDFADHVL